MLWTPDTVIHILILVTVIVCAGAITVAIRVLREAVRISRAVGALVIQEEEKTHRLFQR